MVHGQSYANLLHWVVSLWQQNCYCICSEGAVTGIALVQGLKAAHVTRTVPRGKNRWARIWLVVNHQGWGRWCTEALKVHRSAVQAVHTGQKSLSLCGSCSGCGVILEDHDKYYTFSPSRRASAFCLIYAPPSPLSPHWLNRGLLQNLLWGQVQVKGKWHASLKESFLLC